MFTNWTPYKNIVCTTKGVETEGYYNIKLKNLSTMPLEEFVGSLMVEKIEL